jgi:hypothetical protein
MKKILVMVLFLLALSAAAFAEETLLIGKGTDIGAYGGPMASVTTVDGQAAVMSGGRGALIIANTFIIGGGGYSLSIPVEKDIAGGPYDINFGYGGLELGITVGSDSLLHFTSNVLLGAGSVSYQDSPGNSSHFYVVEPHGYLEINVLEWMRICVGAGYRFVFGVEGVQGLTDSDLWGPSGELLFKFGSF